MNEVIVKAHPICLSQIEKIKKDCPAFLTADLSDEFIKALKLQKNPNEKCPTGRYYTTAASENSKNQILSVRSDGLIHTCGIYQENCAGTRISLHVLYNKNEEPALNWTTQRRTTQIWNTQTEKLDTVISSTTVVKFGEKEYIWLNKKECEDGTQNTMELISLKLITISVPFDKHGKSNSFVSATELQEQYYKLATEGCTEKEKSLIVAVKLSTLDNCSHATPMPNEKQRAMINENKNPSQKTTNNGVYKN